MESNELLTPNEAAAKLRISVATIRRLLRDGKLKGIKAGERQWRIPAAGLQKFIERGSKE